VLLRGAVVQRCDLIAGELTVGVGVGSIDGVDSSTNPALLRRRSLSLSNCDMSSARLSVPQLAHGSDDQWLQLLLQVGTEVRGRVVACLHAEDGVVARIPIEPGRESERAWQMR
jgi:hypothetical protein